MNEANWWYFLIILYTMLLIGIIVLAILYPLRATEIGPTGPSGASGLPATPGGVQGLSLGITTGVTTDYFLFLTSQIQVTDVDPATEIITYSDLAPYDLTLNGFVLHGAFSNPTGSAQSLTGNVYRGDTSSSTPGAIIGDAYISASIPSLAALNQASTVITFASPVFVAQGERLAFGLFTNGCTVNSLSIALFWT